MHKNASRVMVLVLLCLTSRAHAEATQGLDHVVIDGVRIPFGTIVEVSGPCQGRDFDRLGGGATTLRLLRLDGKANQDNFELLLYPSATNNVFSYELLSALERGKSYKARGRLVFARDWRPPGTQPPGGSRSAHVAVALGFADLVDRAAAFDGTAGAEGQFQTEGGAALVEGVTAWPQSVEGKKITVRGVIRRANGGWRIERPSWHRVELAEQLGQDVSLDGTLWSSNGKWWLRYRDHVLFLTSTSGPNMSFPGRDHGRLARVTGQLVRQDRPAIKGINASFGTELVPCFVVRGAKVEYLEEPADGRSRFGPVYGSFHTVRDGVPELLAESNPGRMRIGGETEASLYLERNADVIDEILRRATPETRAVLARRMEDSKLPDPLRFLYAGMLLRLDDARGRFFLLSRADPNGPPSIDALFCLGAFLSSAPAKTEIQWAEPPLIALMTSKVLAHPERFAPYSESAKDLWVFGIDPQTFTVADATSRFSEIPNVLLTMRSAPARRAVIDYLLADGLDGFRSEIIRNLRLFDTTMQDDPLGESDMAAWSKSANSGSVLLPLEDLLKLEAAAKGRYDRLAILCQLLRHKHHAAVEEFLEDLKDSFAYSEIRDHSSPEVIEVLRAHIPALAGQAKDHAEMLVMLAQKDPIPSLLGLLEDAKWTDRNLVLYELARRADPRAVAPLARFSEPHRRCSSI